MSKFNIGDEVEVINGRDYSITKEGSYGTVVRIASTNVYVAFKYTPSGEIDTWRISKKDLKLLKEVDKKQRVIDKVSLIYSCQRERGIVHV